MTRQNCAVCAWRENCAKKFCIPDGGSRCPDFSRDVSIKDIEEETNKLPDQKEQ
ncbi:MAG: hypothetical protein PHP95_06905 [Desulfuromonadaceae bacterium]|jgi:hypothetical protein|nr:hypothetical protein [Desulfuromonadaceae bacterium]MDD2848169.1 hypothetical protein [Desulfuromonadaceae bacterium]MDD4130664.1 hypothetical protein [Desulfuromonadaceae bacterium]